MATLTPTTTPSTRNADPTLARRALLLDAAASGTAGVVAVAGAGVLDVPLGIPSGWLLGLGVFMLAYAADLVLTARALPRSARHVRLVWVAASVGAVVFGAWSLTGWGMTVVGLQAVAVAGFAILQLRAAAGVSQP